MTLGYRQQFPNGSPTQFREKILLSQGLVLKRQVYNHDPKQYLEQYCSAGQMVYDNIDGTVPVEYFPDLQLNYRPKIHSIREDKHDRWRPGLKIHHVYGNRTPQRECFLVNECVWVQRITIFDSKIYEEENGEVKDRVFNAFGLPTDRPTSKVIMVDGRFMPYDKCVEIAHNDGFDSLDDFFAWFNKDYSGKILHWTKLRY